MDHCASYPEMLAWLYSRQMFGIKLGLENTQRLLEALGHPEQKLRFFHVAGTNGKGSVCAMLASVLKEAGNCVGLFTSPHLIEYRGRIQINGACVSEEIVASILEEIRYKTSQWEHSPTFFEISFVLSLQCFANHRCDYVVLETGMGGRWDATNTISPLVSVLTPIGLDHQKWLGDTLEEIANEKAGIIKPNIPVVSARQPKIVEEVLKAKAWECGVKLNSVQKPWAGTVGLKGAYQQENAAVALMALRAAQLSLDEEVIAKGLIHTQWPGRFQYWNSHLILDGAHNPHAARNLVQTWKEYFGDEKATLIFGGLSDKNLTEMLAILESITKEFFFVPVRSPRSESPETLAKLTPLPYQIFSSVPEALNHVLDTDKLTLVSGSLFLVGEALAYLQAESRPEITTQ